MKLDEARNLADALVAALSAYCVRLMVCGSIRRQRPEVKDIDIVCEPIIVSERDGLFSDSMISLLERGLKRAVSLGLIALSQDGPKHKCGTIMHGGKSIAFDLYVSTPEQWATLVLVRTGSREHNVKLCQVAQSMGGKLHADGSGVTMHDQLVMCEREEDVFEALDHPWVEPENRS